MNSWGGSLYNVTASQLAGFMVNKVNSQFQQSNSKPGGSSNAAKGIIVLACANRLIYQSHWQSLLKCVYMCTYVSVYSSFHQCVFSCSVCLSVFAFVWVIGIRIRREQRGEKDGCTYTRVSCELLFFCSIVLWGNLFALPSTQTHRDRDNYLTLYPPQYEILPLKTSLTSLTIDRSAGVGGTSGQE